VKNVKYIFLKLQKIMINLTIKRELKFPGSIYFRYVGEITEGEAMEFQIESGFHPHGYGFYGFISKDNISKWICSNSCD